MAKTNYDPAHEGELAARRDNYRRKQDAYYGKTKLTAEERQLIGKAILNLELAARALHILIGQDNHGKLTGADKEMALRYDVNDTVEIALGQIKNLL